MKPIVKVVLDIQEYNNMIVEITLRKPIIFDSDDYFEEDYFENTREIPDEFKDFIMDSFYDNPELFTENMELKLI